MEFLRTKMESNLKNYIYNKGFNTTLFRLDALASAIVAKYNNLDFKNKEFNSIRDAVKFKDSFVDVLTNQMCYLKDVNKLKIGADSKEAFEYIRSNLIDASTPIDISSEIDSTYIATFFDEYYGYTDIIYGDEESVLSYIEAHTAFYIRYKDFVRKILYWYTQEEKFYVESGLSCAKGLNTIYDGLTNDVVMIDDFNALVLKFDNILKENNFTKQDIIDENKAVLYLLEQAIDEELLAKSSGYVDLGVDEWYIYIFPDEGEFKHGF